MVWILAIIAGIIYLCVQVYQFAFWAAIIVIFLLLFFLYVGLKLLIHLIKKLAEASKRKREMKGR